MGFGLPDEKLHAPNEHFNLDNFDKGLLTITDFLRAGLQPGPPSRRPIGFSIPISNPTQRMFDWSH